MKKEEFINKCLILKNLPDQRYDEPFIIALSGYSGSGKSHVAKILSQRLGLYIVGGDAVRQKIYQDSELKHLELEEIQNLTNYISELKIKKILRENMSIVIDRSISSLDGLNNLKKLNIPVFLINLISDHEQNIERIINRSNNCNDLGSYGDIDSKSGVKTREMYEEIKERKIYNIPNEIFNYIIDARKSLEDVTIQTNNIANDISLNIVKNKTK